MSQLIDISGETFGDWTVAGRVAGRKGYWHCQCACGKKAQRDGRHLRRGTSMGCGCSRDAQARIDRFRGVGELHQGVVSRIRAGASLRGHEFALDVGYLWKLFTQQNRRCVFTGLELTLPTDLGVRAGMAATASLDRIDSNEGYIVGNVQWVHKKINMMKRHMSDEEFITFCTRVAKHRGNDTCTL